MSSGFYCYFWGVSPLSVLGSITRLETHAPPFPLLASLSQAVAGPRGSQLLRGKAPPGTQHTICPGRPLPLPIPICQGHVDRADQKVLQNHSSRQSCGSSRARSSCSLLTGQRLMRAAPAQHLQRAANPVEGAPPGPCSAAFRGRGGCCSGSITRSKLGSCLRTRAG